MGLCFAALIGAGALSVGYLARAAADLIDTAELGAGTAGAASATHRILTVRIAKSQDGSSAAASERRDGTTRASADRSRVHGVGDQKTTAKRRVNPSATQEASPATYRTVCVRECDGGYFPISFSTTREHFARDASACTRRCGVPARLFVYPLSGGSTATMVDLDGRPYSALANADRFRIERVAACSCDPEAWQQEAASRHRVLELGQKAEMKPWEAKELALRTAIEEVRQLRPGGLAALTTGAGSPATHARRSGPLPGDVQPLIGGKELEAERPEIAVRYTGELKPVSVVYDATGRPVILKPQPKTAQPPVVTVIARIADPAPAGIATASIGPDKRSVETQVNEPLAHVAEGGPEAKSADALQIALAAASAPKASVAGKRKSQTKTASLRRAPTAVGGGRANLMASADQWYGNRIYSGSDWRLSNYQALE
jgi:hypothetical protein